MSVLNDIAAAKKEISMGSVVFSGRLTSAVLIMATRSIPSTKYYYLRFERNIKSLKGTIPKSYQFEFQQICESEGLIREDGTMRTISEINQPTSGQSYVAIYNPDECKIETLIEMNEKDLSFLQKELHLR